MDAKVMKYILDSESFESEIDGCSLFYDDNSLYLYLVYRITDDVLIVDLRVNDAAVGVNEECYNVCWEAAASFCKGEDEIEPDPALTDNYWNNGVSEKDFY